MTVLPTDVGNEEELDFDKMNVIELFKKKNYQVHMGMGTASNIQRPMKNVLDTSAGPYLVRTSFLPVNGATALAPSTACLSNPHRTELPTSYAKL